jgi:hypothetical protein
LGLWWVLIGLALAGLIWLGILAGLTDHRRLHHTPHHHHHQRTNKQTTNQPNKQTNKQTTNQPTNQPNKQTNNQQAAKAILEITSPHGVRPALNALFDGMGALNEWQVRKNEEKKGWRARRKAALPSPTKP